MNSVKIFTTFLFLLFSTLCIVGQNLIPNPSFEQVTKYADDKISGSRDHFELKITHWTSPTNVSPDILKLSPDNANYSERFRLPTPIEGTCMAGMIIGYPYNACKTYREYLQIKLLDTLLKGNIYQLEFWITSKESGVYDLGGYFNTKKLRLGQCGRLEYTPHLETAVTIQKGEWKKVKFLISPKKNYTHLVLGNFNKSKEEVRTYKYVFIDKISLLQSAEKTVENTSLLPQVDLSTILRQKNILYQFRKAVPTDSSFKELNKLIEYLQQNKSVRLVIEGHTDNIGSPNYNQQLSFKRAAAVQQYLITKGIALSRISAYGFGAQRPIASNQTEQGRRLNRRVELRIIAQ